MRTPTRALVLALPVSLAIGLGACSSSAEEASTSTSGSTGDQGSTPTTAHSLGDATIRDCISLEANPPQLSTSVVVVNGGDDPADYVVEIGFVDEASGEALEVVSVTVASVPPGSDGSGSADSTGLEVATGVDCRVLDVERVGLGGG